MTNKGWTITLFSMGQTIMWMKIERDNLTDIVIMKLTLQGLQVLTKDYRY